MKNVEEFVQRIVDSFEPAILKSEVDETLTIVHISELVDECEKYGIETEAKDIDLLLEQNHFKAQPVPIDTFKFCYVMRRKLVIA
jgi:hypothetical protein